MPDGVNKGLSCTFVASRLCDAVALTGSYVRVNVKSLSAIIMFEKVIEARAIPERWVLSIPIGQIVCDGHF